MIFVIANLATMRGQSLQDIGERRGNGKPGEVLKVEKAEVQLSPNMVSAVGTRALPGKARFLATRTCIPQSHPTLYTLHLITSPSCACTPLYEVQNSALTRNEVRKPSWQLIQQERPSPCPSLPSVQLLT